MHAGSVQRALIIGSGSLFVLSALAWLSQVQFLAFHVLVELFAVVVGLGMGVVAWHTHSFTRNGFFLVLGAGFFWVALLDLAHMLVYKGMGIFPVTAANLATQLWLGARFVEVAFLLGAPGFLHRSPSAGASFVGAGLVAATPTGLIALGWFPAAFVEGVGLTPFKVHAEYLIIALLLVAIPLYQHRLHTLESHTRHLLLTALGCTILSELAFTLYVSVYGLSNVVGHFAKLLAFALFYRAIVLVNLKQPFQMLSQTAHSFDAISHPVVLVDRQGVIHQVNRFACHMVGQPPNHLLNTAVHATFHPPVEKEACLFCRYIANGIPLPPTEVYDAERDKWWLVALDPTPLGTEIAGMVQTCQEITPLKQAYSALGENEAKLRHAHDVLEHAWKELGRTLSLLEKLFHTPHLSIVFLDRHFRFIRVNDTYARECGQKPDFFPGKNHFQLFPNPENEAIFRQVVENGQPFSVEAKPFAFPDHPEWGVTYWDWSLDPVKGERGEVEWLIFALRNVTERKRQELALQESERFSRTVVESIGEGFVVLDRALRHRMWNPAMERISGAPAEAVLGRHPLECFPHLRNTPLWQDLETALRGEAAASGDILFQLPGGGEGWLQARHFPLRETDGAVAGVIGVVTDVTQRKRAELERERLHQQALRSARLASVGALSVGIAHEVNNPNNAIALNIALLVEGWTEARIILEEHYREHGDFSLAGLPYSEMRDVIPILLASIHENSLRIKKVIENMKYLVRGQPPSVMHPLDLHEVVIKAALNLQNKGERRQAPFQVQEAMGLPKVTGNPDQLEQVFVNLLSNARHALTDRSQGIAVTFDHNDAEVRVEVRDEGCGIPPEVLGRIEEPFFTTRSQEGGMGFGLFITRNILELHGARMTFASEPGEGTTVTLLFPLGLDMD